MDIRVTLTRDFTDDFGLQFKAGQKGTASSRNLDGCRIVTFDGYEAERQQFAKFKAEHPGASYVTPWEAIVPERLLKREAPKEET